MTEGRIEIEEAGRRRAFGPPGAELSARIRVRDPRFWRSVARRQPGARARRTPTARWDCDDLVRLVRIGAREMPRLDRLRAPARARCGARSPACRATPAAAARKHIAAHYDLGNDLFRALPRRDDDLLVRASSSGPDDDAARGAGAPSSTGSAAKLELTPDDHVLEIGTRLGLARAPRGRPLRLPGDHHHALARAAGAMATSARAGRGSRRAGGGAPGSTTASCAGATRSSSRSR